MSPVWQRYYNDGQLFPPTFLPTDDADGDGKSNYHESLAGTDPTSSQEFFRAEVTRIPATYLNSTTGGQPTALSPESFIIHWPGISGKLYDVQVSPDLSPGSWVVANPEPIWGFDGENEFPTAASYTDGTRPERLFWRVAVTDAASPHPGSNYSQWDELILASHPEYSNPPVTSEDPEADDDEDGVPNKLDAASQDEAITWAPTPIPGWILTELIPTAPNLSVQDVSPKGTVLLYNSNTYAQILIDRSGVPHHFNYGTIDPFPIGVMRAGYAKVLIGEKILGFYRPTAGSFSDNYVWDPMPPDPMTPATPPSLFAMDGYLHSDIIDAPGGFMIKSKSDLFATSPGPLPDNGNASPGSSPIGSSVARIETRGNLIASNVLTPDTGIAPTFPIKYWIFDPGSGTYGNPKLIHTETSSTYPVSATLHQSPTQAWHLAAVPSGVYIAKNDGGFTKSETLLPGSVIGTGTGGWLIGPKHVWANGQWTDLRNAVSQEEGHAPETITVQKIRDNGIGVAKVKYPGDEEKFMKMSPLELSWKAMEGFDNVESHIDPWAKEANEQAIAHPEDSDGTRLLVNGKRIFPD